MYSLHYMQGGEENEYTLKFKFQVFKRVKDRTFTALRFTNVQLYRQCKLHYQASKAHEHRDKILIQNCKLTTMCYTYTLITFLYKQKSYCIMHTIQKKPSGPTY